MACTAARFEIPSQGLSHEEATEEFRKLEMWMFSKAAQALPIHEVEAEQFRRSREVNRLLLEAHIRERGDGECGSVYDLRANGDKVLLFQRGRIHDCIFRSIFGEVNIKRRSYSLKEHFSVHPVDEKLSLPARSFSYEVQRRLTLAAVQGPFDEAIAGVQDFTGMSVPKRTAEQVVVEAAKYFDLFYKERAAVPPSESGPIIVGSVDGKGIPMKKLEPVAPMVRRKKGDKINKKRMATVAAVYTTMPRVRTAEDVVESLFRPPLKIVPKTAEEKAFRKQTKPQNKRVFASLIKGKDRTINEVQEEIERRDPDKTKTRVAITDGERALQLRVIKILTGVTLILDLLHVLQRVWAAAHVFHAEGSEDAQAWVKKQALRILQGKVSHVVRGLRQSATKRRLKGKALKTITSTTAYLYKNRRYMEYDKYLSKGLPIASGAVEGACKNLIKDRMERSGMRWSETMAEAMVRLRAIYLSGDFDEYWRFHTALEQLRLASIKGRELPKCYVRK